MHFILTLKQLRKIRGLRQSDMKVFEQTSVSKIEGRKDLKISTLLDYLNALDMDLEVRALSRPQDDSAPEVFPLIAPEPEQEMDEEIKAAPAKEKEPKKVKPPKPELPQLSNFPSVSMVETNKEILLAAEVPGLSRKDLIIGLNINSVSLSGKKKWVLPENKGKALASEVKYGAFNRTVKFPCDVEIRKSRVKARVRNGLFTMTLLKKDYKKVKSIPVA